VLSQELDHFHCLFIRDADIVRQFSYQFFQFNSFLQSYEFDRVSRSYDRHGYSGFSGTPWAKPSHPVCKGNHKADQILWAEIIALLLEDRSVRRDELPFPQSFQRSAPIGHRLSRSRCQCNQSSANLFLCYRSSISFESDRSSDEIIRVAFRYAEQ
jgi:hypothetical protein